MRIKHIVIAGLVTLVSPTIVAAQMYSLPPEVGGVELAVSGFAELTERLAQLGYQHDNILQCADTGITWQNFSNRRGYLLVNEANAEVKYAANALEVVTAC